MLREIEVEENWVTGNFVPNFVTQVQRIGVDIARDRGRAGKNYITLAQPVDQPFDKEILEEVTKSDGKKTTTEFVPSTKEIIMQCSAVRYVPEKTVSNEDGTSKTLPPRWYGCYCSDGKTEKHIVSDAWVKINLPVEFADKVKQMARDGKMGHTASYTPVSLCANPNKTQIN